MIIGNYEYDINNIIGRGAFSTVYKGFCTLTKMDVAIKIIEYDVVKNYILENEIEIMKYIKNNPHPNIIKCYDIYDKQNQVFIVLEYCDTGDLSKILLNPMLEKYVKYYFIQLTEGIKYLHDNNIIHRDIKPKNILLTSNKKILKIADFGLACMNESLHDTICGSPMYMAPEIGKNYYDNKVDLWSCGLILYEMLYGQHPFSSLKTPQELYKIKNNVKINIPPNYNTNDTISYECIELLKKILNINANTRISFKDFFSNNWLKSWDDDNNDEIKIIDVKQYTNDNYFLNMDCNHNNHNDKNTIYDIDDEMEDIFDLEMSNVVTNFVNEDSSLNDFVYNMI